MVHGHPIPKSCCCAAQLAELGRERNKLNVEKAELENTLEAEQEFIANRLQMQVCKLGSAAAVPGATANGRSCCQLCSGRD